MTLIHFKWQLVYKQSGRIPPKVTPVRIGEIMSMIKMLAMICSAQRENIEKFEPSVSSTT